MIIELENLKPKKEVIDQIVRILEKGGLIVYPTETAYGLGCDGLNIKAIEKIYEVKSRPQDSPLPVIVDSIAMIEQIAFLHDDAKILIEKYHPGPLVIALKKKDLIPDILNKDRIAFRISSNELIKNTVTRLGKPIVSTSANKTGSKPPYSVTEVFETINKSDVDIILDVGIIDQNKPSTIVDFVEPNSPQIIREGAISAIEILQTLNIDEEKWSQHVKHKKK